MFWYRTRSLMKKLKPMCPDCEVKAAIQAADLYLEIFRLKKLLRKYKK